MSNNKLTISVKQTITIKKFMEQYLGVKYDGNKKLTHYQMRSYLFERGYELPIPIDNASIDIKDIYNGKYLAVRDEKNKSKKNKSGKIFIYKNPKYVEKVDLFKEFSTQKNKLKKIRDQILREQYGLTTDELGEIISMEEYEKNQEEDSYTITSSVNRQKQYVYSSRNHIVRRRRY